MNLNFGKSQSTQMPLLLDTESSESSVYIRRNVEEKQREDEHVEGGVQTYYEYEEAVLTRMEYQQYLNEQLQAENTALKAQIAENADAMIELAGMIDKLNTKTDEQADALIEIAGMVVN